MVRKSWCSRLSTLNSQLSTSGRSFGQREVKGGASIGFCLGPGAAAVPGNNASHIGQANAEAFKFLDTMEALKDAKELVRKLHVESDAIVADVDDRLGGGIGRATDFDFCRVARLAVFDRIGEEVIEDIPQEGGIGLDLWKR